jgi:hypothetical protein
MLCLRSSIDRIEEREQNRGAKKASVLKPAKTANHARATTREDGPYFAIQRVTSSSQVRKTAGIRTPELSRISLRITVIEQAPRKRPLQNHILEWPH